jgi:hypothetical protein
MNTRPLLHLVAIVSLAASVIAADTHKLSYEIRAPKSIKLDGLTAFDVVTDQGISGTRLRLTKHREEDGFNVYADSCLLDHAERRRAIVVRSDSGPEPNQVFVLTIPRTPKPADWSKWQGPDYVEKSDAAWSFMHDLKKHDRSTNIPPNCLEVRYKVTEWKP